MTVQTTGNRKKIWRLGPNEQEELVFRMQGVISKLDLQPGNVAR